MSTLKKVLALTLAIAMVLSLNVFAAFKDQDKINEDCVSAMEMMNTLGIMLGDENNNANPEKTITRAEAAAMIFRLMNKGNADASMYNGMKVFTDVPSGIWYEGYVNYCYTMGIVQGRTATTFDPSAPVTGYEIAKMLLTCLKYNAEKQGYTGANWAKNVQNDAFAANLLEDYGMGLSLPAQRQWVAVMFNQALSCFVAKYYLGELTIDETNTNTLGYRNFGLSTVKGTLTAIENAVVDGTAADEGYSKLGSEASYKYVADKNLLGQQVKVTFNSKTGKVYGIVATGKSKLGVAKLDEVTKSSGDVTDATKFTVGAVTATAPAATKVFYPNADCEYVAAGRFSTYYNQNSVAEVRAVDTDANGVFDYIMIDFSQYGVVTIAKDGKYTFAGTTKEAKYVNCINTVATKDFVKVTANVFTGKYDVEALTASVAILTKKNAGNTEFALAGTTYGLSDDANNILPVTPFALKDKVEFYADGKYIVKAKLYEAAVSGEMGTLVMLTAKGKTVSTDPYAAEKTTYLVKALGLDGKVLEYEFNDATGEGIAENHEGLTVGAVYELKENTGDDAGTYKLLAPAAGYVVTGTNPSTTYKYNKVTSSATLDYKTGKMGSVIVSADAKMFMIDKTKDTSVEKTNSAKWTFSVVALADLKSNQTVNMYYTTKNANGITTMAVGCINTGVVTVTSDAVYARTTSDAYDEYVEADDKTYTRIDVVYADGTEATLNLNSSNAVTTKQKLVTVVLTDGKAALTDVTPGETSTINAATETMVQIGANLKDIAKDTIVVLKVADKIKFATMADIVEIYLDVNGDQVDYTALVGAAKETNSDGEYAGFLFFVATEA